MVSHYSHSHIFCLEKVRLSIAECFNQCGQNFKEIFIFFKDKNSLTTNNIIKHFFVVVFLIFSPAPSLSHCSRMDLHCYCQSFVWRAHQLPENQARYAHFHLNGHKRYNGGASQGHHFRKWCLTSGPGRDEHFQIKLSRQSVLTFRKKYS